MSTSTRPVSDLLVQEVMTASPTTVAADAPILDAWSAMCGRGVHHLPVLDGQGGYLGMIDAGALAAAWPGGGPRHAERPISTMLAGRRHPRVRPGDPVESAAATMTRTGVSAIAVLGGGGRLVGLVTTSDLVAAIARQAHPGHHHTGASLIAPD